MEFVKSENSIILLKKQDLISELKVKHQLQNKGMHCKQKWQLFDQFNVRGNIQCALLNQYNPAIWYHSHEEHISHSQVQVGIVVINGMTHQICNNQKLLF